VSPEQGAQDGETGYPPEFRRKVLDLIDAGREGHRNRSGPWPSVPRRSTNWHREHRIDQGLEAGLSSGERAELVAARQRIAQLESELKIARRAAKLLKDVKPPKVRYAAIEVMAARTGVLAGTGLAGNGIMRSGHAAPQR
jgi:hypothetical protein